MVKQISNVHAKNPMATEGQVLKGLDETAIQDQEKLKRIVDYDIQPEIELRLHALIKEINQALDDIKKVQEQVDPSVSEEPVQELDVIQKTQQLKAECSQLEMNLDKMMKTKKQSKSQQLRCNLLLGEKLKKS